MGFDLWCNNVNEWDYRKCHYSNVNIPLDFTVEEYEVFQVVKK